MTLPNRLHAIDTQTSQTTLTTVLNTTLEMKPRHSSPHHVPQNRIEAFDVHQLIQEVITIFEAEASNKDIELQYKLINPVDSLWIGAPIATRRILIRLLSSAIHDISRGSIRLELEAKYADTVKACFSITDGNIGLSDTLHQQLVLARDMASELGGTVELDNSCPNGTRLRLTLYFEVGDLVDPATTPRRQAVRKLLQNRRALVADDLDFNRYINTEILSRMGADVVTAQDGTEALQQLQSEQHDLALLDIDMPGLSGIEVVQQYLSSKPSRPTQFIALSAHATGEMEHACIAAGFKYFIHKPLTQKKITAQLAETFNLTEQPNDTSLLEYLAQDSPTALEQLKARQQKAFQLELQTLKKQHADNDVAGQRRAVHKLTGVASIQRDPLIIELLEQLSAGLKAQASPHSIAGLIHQLSDQIENQ